MKTLKQIILMLACLSFFYVGYAQTKPQLIVETDLGGDADDQGSLVRLLLYSNDLNIKGIILSRDDTKFLKDGASSNPSNATDAYDMAMDYISAYGAVYNNLKVHDENYPTAQSIKDVTKRGWGTDGKNMILTIFKNTTGPIWYTNWGCNDGNVSSLKKALDDLKAGLVSGLTYNDVVNRLYYVEAAGSNLIGSTHRAAVKFYMDTFYPDMDGGRWYHRWSPLTSIYTWMLSSTSSTLCKNYYTTAKEGDTPTWMHLVMNGINVEGKPNWGSWSGRFGWNTTGWSGWWCNQQDNYNGTTNRDNTLKRWGGGTQAVHIMNDFKARAKWADNSSFSGGNHHPVIKINGKSGFEVLNIKASANSTVALSADGTTDPDGNTLTYQWVFYKEISNGGNVTLSNATTKNCTVNIPSDFSAGETIHVYLQVTDNGAIPLTRYARALIEYEANKPLQILCLGNSITQGNTGHNTYRRNLYNKLKAAGYNFDFVGSMNKNAACANYADATFDPDHEGHWGWRVDQLINGSTSTCYGNGKLSDWLANYTPDMVLLHLGTNDVFQNNSHSSTISEIKTIITTLRNDNPSVVIFLAKLIPTAGSYKQGIIDLNALIPAIKDEMSTTQSPIIIVDQFEGFNADTDTYDTTHPNDAGEEKMATKWINAINVHYKGNTLPSISISSPASGSSFTPGNSITITANATDVDGSIAKVEFYQGSIKLGEDVSYPYSFVWNNVAAGTYSITAKAFDDNNASKTSSAITINVVSSVSYSLTVNSGTGSGNYVSGTIVTITANAAPAGKVFDKWTGDVNGIANVNGASTTITMPASNVNISATYIDITSGLITSVSVKGLKASNLQTGAQYYSDRTFTIKTLPSGFAGLEYIKTANNDKTNTSVSYLTLTLTADAVLYIAYDYRATSVPTWMSSWTKTSDVITTTDVSLNIYSKELTAGTYTLGGNMAIGAVGAGSNYFVIAKTNGQINTYVLTVNSGTGTGSYAAGTVVNITANAEPTGKVFDKWTGDITAVANVNSASTTLTMPSAIVSVSATYKDVVIPEELIINVSAKGNKATNLQVGSVYYTDRTFTIKSLPSNLLGAEFIKTANNDKGNTSESYLTFTLTAEAYVAIAYDSRATAVPNWMSTWDKTTDVITTTDVTLNVYQKLLPAGTYTLGGNKAAGALGAGSNYFVVGYFVASAKSRSMVTAVEESNTEINMYPIPANDILHIQSERGIASLRIVNLSGALQLKQDCLGQISHTINVEQLTSGCYLIEIVMIDGIRVIERFFKE